jgi:dienelactone hydrolase
MRFELLLCVLGSVLTVIYFFADPSTYFQPLLPATMLILLLLHLWVTPYRWQISPLWFVLIATQASFLFNLTTNSPGWYALLVLCTLGVFLAVALVVGYPLLKLPLPDGRYGIGSVTHTLVDPDRAAFETSTEKGRRLFVKIWYPSDHKSSPNDRTSESLWQDLYRSDLPRSARWSCAYLQSVPTNTVSGASFATGVENPQLLIYNHGGISVPSENTTLMEYLASHGYVVLSIYHLDQLAEYNALNAEVPEAVKERNKALEKRIKSSIGYDKKAELSLEHLRSSSVMNRMVATRVVDIDHVLNNAPALLSRIPSLDKGALSVDRIGLLGFSLGGAVATEFSKNDERCATVVNIDGGLYGTQMEEPISVPYLMMNGDCKDEWFNDLVLKNATVEVHILTMPQTKHGDFGDVKLVSPIMRWLGALGKAPTREFMDKKNKLIREHFEAYLG